MTERTCRCCGRNYEYPEHGASATRYYCTPCAELPAPTRLVVQNLQGELRKLRQRVEVLEKELSAARGPLSQEMSKS